MKGGDSRGWLGRQFELELVEHELEFGLGLGMAGELDLAPVGGWNVDVDQLQGGELLQDASWGEARGERGQPSCQSGVQTIGEEGNEEVVSQFNCGARDGIGGNPLGVTFGEPVYAV